MDIFHKLKKAVLKEEQETFSGHSRERIASEEIKNKFMADPDFPFLVSFSRTGSHWLRMIMELYFEKPSLKLLFFQSVAETKDYSCVHTHDLDLSVFRTNVIYLYRDPTETIFSQLSYHGQDLNNMEMISGWANLYGEHMNKWLIQDSFTKKKVVLTYEGMKSNLDDEFKKLCQFYDTPFDAEKLKKISGSVSKEKIKEKTAHDPKVININADYSNQRKRFVKTQSELIDKIIFGRFPELKKYFNEESI